MSTDAEQLQPGARPDWQKIGEAREKRWREDGRLKLSDLGLSLGDRFTLRHGDRIVYDEARDGYDYAETAWSILRPEAPTPAKWKTLGLFRSLRQAIREHYVQGMPIALPCAGTTQRQIRVFLDLARAYDRQHHGAATF